ncbi:hypothetical protein [Chitinimonas koreensis]|uniref:hypothetical protein n=1 Tax=Chitinimonas koreensis TaxID=356302 RepID=UPI0012F77B4A|nr:hypothetical protein [Chitinimonas koreensis]QNM95486.1 hypothetical protein H9L41_16665 [Chitinimonas koreensis]
MKLHIETADGKRLVYTVRVIAGMPPGNMEAAYEILDDEGRPQHCSVEMEVDRHKTIEVFDCIEVVQGDAYAFNWLQRKRGMRLGQLVQR